ncbi:hypothetical protein [Alkalicoccus chagannorensis]|uniref:hypothetical protein n=1 Tax=Alkalicoccus chagannorensis TaxID=427072 RepID=UPI000421A48D|nr:hypothetical protein [Alkalicoccus chagannorensis]
MKGLLEPLFSKLYGPVPADASLRLYYWVTAVIFFFPAAASPVFFVSYLVQSGPAFAFTYGLLMLFIVWILMPVIFRLIMKMNRFLFNEKDRPPEKKNQRSRS